MDEATRRKLIEAAKHELPDLRANIDTVLNGTATERDAFRGKKFFIADTPPFMKQYDLTGDYFIVRYGEIRRKKDKDPDHNLTVDDWKALINEITQPFGIAKRTEADGSTTYQILLNLKVNGHYVLVAAEVIPISREVQINNVKTVFGK
jgi:hypothetical protein